LNHLVDLVDKDAAVKRYGPTMSFDQARALAIEFAVNDVAQCRATLLDGKVTTQVCGDRTSISASEACGVAITMVPAAAPLN
jgi:hypothetical protein